MDNRKITKLVVAIAMAEIDYMPREENVIGYEFSKGFEFGLKSIRESIFKRSKPYWDAAMTDNLIGMIDQIEEIFMENEFNEFTAGERFACGFVKGMVYELDREMETVK